MSPVTNWVYFSLTRHTSIFLERALNGEGPRCRRAPYQISHDPNLKIENQCRFSPLKSVRVLRQIFHLCVSFQFLWLSFCLEDLFFVFDASGFSLFFWCLQIFWYCLPQGFLLWCIDPPGFHIICIGYQLREYRLRVAGTTQWLTCTRVQHTFLFVCKVFFLNEKLRETSTFSKNQIRAHSL